MLADIVPNIVQVSKIIGKAVCVSSQCLGLFRIYFTLLCHLKSQVTTMVSIKTLICIVRIGCLLPALVSVFIYPVDEGTSDISVTVYGLSWMMSALEVVLSLGFLLTLRQANPLPHDHILACSLIILFEWLIAFHTMGAATSTITVTMAARNIVFEYRKKMVYGVLVLVAGTLASCAAFLNIILAKNLRHPPAANN